MRGLPLLWTVVLLLRSVAGMPLNQAVIVRDESSFDGGEAPTEDNRQGSITTDSNLSATAPTSAQDPDAHSIFRRKPTAGSSAYVPQIYTDEMLDYLVDNVQNLKTHIKGVSAETRTYFINIIDEISQDANSIRDGRLSKSRSNINEATTLDKLYEELSKLKSVKAEPQLFEGINALISGMRDASKTRNFAGIIRLTFDQETFANIAKYALPVTDRINADKRWNDLQTDMAYTLYSSTLLSKSKNPDTEEYEGYESDLFTSLQSIADRKELSDANIEKAPEEMKKFMEEWRRYDTPTVAKLLEKRAEMTMEFCEIAITY
ncbi:MAG: hypothetical protein M1829_001689 [Trizodia sp. TS-e1964]|nr:MAG: hypothetical protein M1829_001689 [Trizodia sp. TS-e1964]